MCGGLERLQMTEIGVPDRASQSQAHAAAAALSLDEAGLLKFMEVMRDGSGADAAMRVEPAAEQAVGCGDLLQNGEAAGIGEGAGDRLKLLQSELLRIRRCGKGHGYLG